MHEVEGIFQPFLDFGILILSLALPGSGKAFCLQCLLKGNESDFSSSKQLAQGGIYTLLGFWLKKSEP